MISTLLNFIRSSAFLYVGGTLTGVGIVAFLGRIWKTMSLRFFLLGLGGVLLCILFVVVIVLLWRVLERKRGENLENALGQDAAARQQQRQQGKVAVQGLKDRWVEAMATLKSTKVRIYDLPWLLLIGEPQSGKTTTLRESGLDFPLGKDSLSGAGGTVNCDWWFTNEAVIIDTAGRFTMSVDTASDREEWQSFLRLLARHRPRCPINGVVVTIPATSLLQDSPETVKNKALTIREKLQELVAILGVEFPVYIMVSKLDLVYGFAEFCASLSNEDRQQALGWNRQNMTPEAFRQDEFEAFSATLVERLNEWARRRLRDVNPGVEADRIYAFPCEFDRLRCALTGYLSLIFRPDRYHIPLLLRGCYFSSGLQEGKSIARAVLEGAEGDDRGVLAEFAKSFVQSRAYFIHAFYSKVFKERWLVKRAGGATKRETIIRITAAGFAMLFLVIAGTMLFSGYRSLVEKVSPLEQQVRHAERVLKNGDTGQIRASEIVQMMQTLDAGRQELINHGAKRFLRSSENTLVEDIGLIEDALFERRFLDILVTGVGKNFNDEKSIQSIEEKDQLNKMLLQYIDILAGKPINTQSMAFLMDLVPWKTTEQIDIDRQTAEQIVQSYPFGGDKGKRSRSIDAGGLYIRQMLTCIHRFWGSFYGIKWQEQKRKLTLINTTYTDLLGANALFTGGINTSGSGQFIQLANNFTDAISEIDPKNEGKLLVWTNGLREKCQADYMNLQNKLAEIPSAGIALMAATAERHSSVCSQLATGVGTEWGTAMEQNHHILLADGSVNPEMFLVRDSVLKIAAVGPLFTAEMKERLKAESENPLLVLGLWHQTWQAIQIDMMKEIDTELGKVNGNGWQKKELLLLCNEQLDKAVLQADQEAALEAIQVVLAADPGAEISALGNETPKVMRASWLASRFMVIQKVGDWMQTIHPGTPDLAQIRSAIDNVMASSWSNCLKFWSERLNAVDPAAGILKTDSWPSFRREVLARHGSFIDLASWPLNAFFEFMASKDIQDVKDIMHNSEGSSRPSNEVFQLEQRVINTSSVYAATRFLPQLNEAQSTFNSAVENLTDDPRESMQILKNGKPGEKVFMDNLKSLGEFQKRISRDPAGRDEPMALRLTKIEDHALSLLRRDVSSAIGNDWQKFVTTWRSRLAGKFPFGTQVLWVGGDNTSNNVRKLSLITASKGELHDFFFSPDDGLEAFADRYHITDTDSSNKKHKVSSVTRETQDFLVKCLAWRSFLFDRDGRPRSHQVRITLEDEHGQNGISAQTTFTKLTMTGLENDKDKSVRLRFSGQKYKAATINWQIGLNSEISMEAKNEETGLTTTIKIDGGNIGFPAYVFWEGNLKERNSSGELGLNMLFPKSVAPLLIKVEAGSVGLSYYRVPVTISWDQALPETIQWPTK